MNKINFKGQLYCLLALALVHIVVATISIGIAYYMEEYFFRTLLLVFGFGNIIFLIINGLLVGMLIGLMIWDF